MRITNQSNKLSPIILTITALLLIFSYPSTLHAAPPWEQIGILRASDKGGNFGNSISLDDNFAVIGAFSHNGQHPTSGAVYVLDAKTDEQLYEFIPTGNSTDYRFGYSVAHWGNNAVIGVRNDSHRGYFAGSASVYDLTTGLLQFNLYADDAGERDFFGASVAISGNLAVIGAIGNEGNHHGSGAAYVFNVTTGQQMNKLIADNGGAADDFGVSVAINGNLAVVDAILDRVYTSGAVYLYNATTGEQQSILLPDDGYIGDRFGQSIAISGNLAVIGAPEADIVDYDSGAAYVFDLTTGQQLIKLLPSDGAFRDYFGYSVAIYGNLAVIGAYGDDDNGMDSGSAYVFDITTGQQLAKLIGSDEIENDKFGYAVSINENEVLIGAPFHGDSFKSGLLYVYEQRASNYLTVEPFPMKVGEDGIFSFVGGLPDETSWLLYSVDGLGKTFLNHLNITVDIANPKIALGPGLTDANGDRQVIRRIPTVTNPMTVWFQAVQHNNVTNFFRTQIVP